MRGIAVLAASQSAEASFDIQPRFREFIVEAGPVRCLLYTNVVVTGIWVFCVIDVANGPRYSIDGVVCLRVNCDHRLGPVWFFFESSFGG